MDINTLNTILSRFDILTEKVGDITYQIGGLQSEVKYIKENVDQNTIDLKEHIAGVQTNRARIAQQEQVVSLQCEALKGFDNRLKNVERIPIFCGNVKKILIWVGGTLGVFFTILQIIGRLF